MSRPFAPRLRVSSYLSAWMPTGDETRQSVAGYFGGGSGPSSVDTSAIDKLSFSAETRTTLSATMSTIVYATGAFANSGIAGYFCGGTGASYYSRIDKIAFPADSKTTLSATLSATVFFPAGMANSGVAGYNGGGDTPTTAIDKITFPADTKLLCRQL